MILTASLLVGILFATATYLVMQGSFVRILFGFIILSNAANLAIMTVSGPPRGLAEPIITDPVGTMVDPLPQALVLTAIVIGFGVTAYLVFLFYRLFLDWKTTDAGELLGKGESTLGANLPGPDPARIPARD